ncbi:ABC transporter substrate-binding protein [Trinickia terrae]|uniref:ABC transporter substrate-binding protein n=1 Tax=Trinickia terrae TaxID=2571161 RepID=UPI00146B817F|nr:extracellular solute-binding protein [Trinickia terrae]
MDIQRYARALGIGVVSLLALIPQARADGLTGEIIVLNWQTGTEHDLLHDLETAFQKSNPSVRFREVNAIGQGDRRGAIRIALMSGEQADLLVNTWPAFRAELADAGMLRPLDRQWDAGHWGDSIAGKWRQLAQYKGVTYGMPFTFGDRSGIFYRPDTLAKAGIAASPKTWDDFLASFKKLKAAGITPIAMPAKVWAHGEWFESLLVRIGGPDVMSKLAAHQISWTDPAVKAAALHYAQMLRSGCCDPTDRMFATEWDNAADETLKNGTHGYELIGMWANGRMKAFGLAEGKDYALFQFPALGAGHDDATVIDAKEFLELKSGHADAAADAFLGWMSSADAAHILAKYGFPSTSSKADTSRYGVVLAETARVVANSKVQFVLGDLLPGDLVDEYRVQLQRLIQDPSDANVDKVLAAIEAKAKTAYQR